MADEKKQYFRDVEPGEVSIEGRQSNGVTADNNGNVFIYSGLKDIELDYLAQQNNDKNIPIYYGNSYVAITKSKTHNTLLLGNNNYETLNEKLNDPNGITTVKKAENTSTICENEFNDAATVLLTWENDNVNLGWDPYGANGSGIKNGEINKAKKYFLDNFWDTNNKNTESGPVGFSIQYYLNSGKTNNDKLLIKNLPPGLRIMAAQFNYNAKQWWSRILVAAYDLTTSLTTPLGIPYYKTSNLSQDSKGNESYEYYGNNSNAKSKTGKTVYNPAKVSGTKDPNKEYILTGIERIDLFIQQYDQIISLYNKDKGAFINALFNETNRYYTTFTVVNGRLELLSFYQTYITKARDLALKYKDCDTSVTLNKIENNTTTSTPSVKEENAKKIVAAPPLEDESTDDFIFLEDQQYELDPVPLTDTSPDNGAAPEITIIDTTPIQSAPTEFYKKLAEEANRAIERRKQFYV